MRPAEPDWELGGWGEWHGVDLGVQWVLEKGPLGGALRLGCDGMAGIVSSCLPKVCRLAGTVLVEFGILEPRLGFGPAGNHFCAI